MNKLEQAARQALEALESCNVGNWSMAFDEFAVVEAITALREALAEPDTEEMTLTQIAARHEQAEQEPVAVYLGHTASMGDVFRLEKQIPVGTKLYAAPVRTKDLTDSEIAELWVEGSTLIEFARAVIAKFKRKNNAV